MVIGCGGRDMCGVDSCIILALPCTTGIMQILKGFVPYHPRLDALQELKFEQSLGEEASQQFTMC